MQKFINIKNLNNINTIAQMFIEPNVFTFLEVAEMKSPTKKGIAKLPSLFYY